MAAKDLSGFSLARFPFWHPLHAFRRRLLFNGKALDALVNGDDIDHVVELDSLHVIATNYDYFDGCNHWIYLLNDRMKLIDAVSMPDYFGFLQDVERHSETQISFSYYGTHDRWNLKVEKQGLWSYSAGALLRRPNLFLLKKRYMLLNRTKGPKWPGVPGNSDKS